MLKRHQDGCRDRDRRALDRGRDSVAAEGVLRDGHVGREGRQRSCRLDAATATVTVNGGGGSRNTQISTTTGTVTVTAIVVAGK